MRRAEDAWSMDGGVTAVGLATMLYALGCVGHPPSLPEVEGASGDAINPTASTGSGSGSGSGSSIDATAPPDSSTGPPEPACGNGAIEGDEVCDDGNIADGDGCSADCIDAHCLVPITHLTVQAGLDDPRCSTVWVLAGTYTETLTIDRDLALRETESGEVVVDASGMGRPLTVTSGIVTVGRLRLTGGLASDGGGIHTATDLTLEGTEVSENQVSGVSTARGGGVFNAGGMLTLSNARIVSNTAMTVVDQGTASGGGLYSEGGTVLLFGGSEVADNTALAVGSSVSATGGGITADAAAITSTGDDRIGGNVAATEAQGENSGSAGGGGLYIQSGSSFEMVGGLIESNRAETTGRATGTACNLSAVGGGLSGWSTSITLDSTRVRDNEAFSQTVDCGAWSRGGAVSVSSNTTVSMTSIIMANNRATAEATAILGDEGNAWAWGGGMYASVGTSTDTVLLEFIDSVVEGNHATATSSGRMSDAWARGGAAHISSATGNAEITLRLERSLVADNHAEATNYAYGGGVYADSSTGQAQTWLTAVNSTFSINSSAVTDASGFAAGGAIYFDDGISLAYTHARLHNTTITENTAGQGGGAYMSGDQLDVRLTNTIVDGNTAALDPDLRCVGSNIDSSGYNLLGGTGGCSAHANDLLGQNALLLPLADNGGPTWTHAIDPASLARNGGNPAGCTDEDGSSLLVDQRGEPRSARAACDIGAFEYRP